MAAFVLRGPKQGVWGLTGGIASGKSAASEILQSLGAAVVDCDVVSRELMEPGSSLLEQTAELFGRGILNSRGGLRRDRLASLVFADAGKLEKLNALVHPAIWKRTFELIQEARASCPLVFCVAPLLFEHGAEAAFDGVMVIDVRPEVQLKRLMKRNGLSKAEAVQRIEAQMSTESKAARADILIDNNGTQKQLASQLESVWAEILRPLYEL